MSKKVFAAIFAAILAVSAFSGCGDNGGSSTPSSSTPSSSSGSSTPVSGSDEPYTPTYPIVSEPVTFTAASAYENMPNTLWYNAYAEATNVNIEWTYWSDWETQMGIALAGDSLPDFVFCLGMSGTDKASIEQYGKAGTLVEYGQYLNIMPNLSAMFEQYPESRVACVNEDGTLYGFPTYLQTPTAYAGTVYYRTDMFKEAGVSEPTTTDELLNAVKTVQEYYSAKDSEFIAFMPYTRTHVTSQLAYWLFPAFGDAVDMDYGTTDGKTVAYNRISDQYRHMMEYLHELYISGGYYKECFSEDGTNTKPLIIGNHCAITTFGTMYSPDNFASGNYDVDMFAPLTSEYTSTQKYAKAYNSRMAASFVSSKCKDVETIMKWIDAFYTTTENPIADGVSGISMWLGTRGVNWDWDDDTHTTYSIKVPDDYDGAGTNWLSEFGCSNAYNCIFMGINNGSPGQICKGTGTINKLLPYSVDVYPSAYLTFSNEDATRIAELTADINTYVGESFASFMIDGVTDDSWNNYVSQIRKMGIDEVVELQQKAYDAYLAGK